MFTWVERKRILGKSDFLIGVQKLDLAENVANDFSIVIAGNGIPDDAEVPRRHDHHLRRPHQDLLVVLPDEGLRPDLNAGHSGRLVEDVDVGVGRDANDGDFAKVSSGIRLIFLHDSVVGPISFVLIHGFVVKVRCIVVETMTSLSFMSER